MHKNKLLNTSAIILCGGQGSRLGSLGKKINKTLIKYNGYPLIHHIIKYLRKYNIDKIIIPLGYRANEIQKYLNKNLLKKDLKIFNAGLSTNITNRVKKSINYLDNKTENVILLNGDSYYEFDLNKLLNKKIHSKKILVNLMCSKLKLDYGFIEKKNTQINFRYKNKVFKEFIDIDGNSNFFYSGLCVIEKNYLKKNIRTIKKNFEIELFNVASKNKKLSFVYDDNAFLQVNNSIDLIILNDK
jgi:NDP-sugar pyrophosphorylase family protein